MNGTIRKPLLVLQALLLIFAGIGVGSLTAKLQPQATPGAVPAVAHAGALVVQPTSPLVPVGNGFTYQGQLLNGGQPAPNGSYDLRFTLYDAPTAGIMVGGPIAPTVVLTSGLFTTNLDFGASAFRGDARYLQIEVRPTGGGGFTLLSPRQPITPVPYALFALDTPPYDNVVIVAKSGGDFTSVGAALASITDNSAANRYLIHIAPGAYTETIQMKQWVDIEGSGEGNTKITFTGYFNPNNGTVRGASNAELRSLTVESTGPNTYAVAIYNDIASPSLLHVTAIASGGTTSNFGVYNLNNSSPKMKDVIASATGGSNSSIGVFNNLNSSPNMTGVRATASGASTTFGVRNETSSSPTMTNVTASAAGGPNSYGVYNENSSLTILQSQVTGYDATNNYGVYNNATTCCYALYIDQSKITGSSHTIRTDFEYEVYIGASQLSGGPVQYGDGDSIDNGSIVKCAGVYDEDHDFFTNTCPYP